jgi:hypothetical protein
MLYFAGSSGTLQPRLYRVEDARTSTERTRLTMTDAEQGGYIHSIAINPDDGAEILVALSNYNIVSLWHSTDSANTYTAVEGNLSGTEETSGSYTYWTGPSVRSATILPTDDGTLYIVGTSTGVYSTFTLDGDNTIWVEESPDLIGNSVVEYIESRDTDGTIVAGTHGRGIFIGTYNPATAVEEPGNSQPTEFDLAQNYPNPFNPTTTINYSLPQADNVAIIVYDINGREVARVVNGYKVAGSHSVIFDATNLSSGIYFYSINSGQYFNTKKMMLLK